MYKGRLEISLKSQYTPEVVVEIRVKACIEHSPSKLRWLSLAISQSMIL
jgi:hypothetical protein